MSAEKLRRWSVVLVGGGILLLALSFLPGQSRTQATTSADVEEQKSASPTELLPEQMVRQGEALFQAKGCPTCHEHEAVKAVSNADFSADIGPDLSDYVPDPDFVRAWLQNPAAIRPNTAMPDLNLSEDEIEALVAFLEA